MKQCVAVILILALALPCAADTRRPLFTSSTETYYVGGTVANLQEGATGQLRTEGETELIFEYNGGKVSIPYRSVVSYKYTEELARHLGVVLTVAVVLLKHRQRRHIIEIAYKDTNGKPQVAIFEVPKDKALTMVSVLQTRAPQSCQTWDKPCRQAKAETAQN
jgi:hypothetical protein